MKTTTSSKGSNYIKTTPIAIFWGRHRAKFRHLFFLALFLFLLGGCDTQEEIPTPTTTAKTTTTIIQTCQVCQECKPVLSDNCQEAQRQLITANAKLAIYQEQGLNLSYYINKLRVFRNQSDYNYLVANTTLGLAKNYSYYTYNKTQKKKMETLVSQLNYLTQRLKEMGNR